MVLYINILKFQLKINIKMNKMAIQEDSREYDVSFDFYKLLTSMPF